VKFNCTSYSYPESEIVWLYKGANLRSSNKKLKRQRHILSIAAKAKYPIRNLTRHAHHKQRRTTKSYQANTAITPSHSSSSSSNANYSEHLSENFTLKYIINTHAINETFKLSTLLINVENEEDYGFYECFSNNSIGSKSAKFYIHGGINCFMLNCNLVSVNKIYLLISKIYFGQINQSIILYSGMI
jgi:hypothetical protein